MKLLQRNAALLLTSFLLSGLVNVHAQEFFASFAGAQKERWLAGALLAGTLASIAGVRLSRRFGFGSAPVRGGAALVVAMLVASGWLFGARGLWGYAVLHVVVRGVANYLTQELDVRATALAEGAARSRNDLIGSGLRFGGMLLGPLWLGTLGHSGWATAGVLALLGALAMGSCVAVANAPPAPVRSVGPGAASKPLPQPLPAEQRRLWVSAVSIYGSYYLLASSAVYVLRDVHHRSDAAQVGSALISSVYASAIVSTIGIGLVTRRGLSRGWMWVAPVAIALAAILLGAPAAGSTAVLFAGGVVLGIAFALFMLAFREHVTARAAAGEPQWIAAYNNLGNSSALVGFGAMALLVALSAIVPGTYADRLAYGLVALSAAALLAGIKLQRPAAWAPRTP